MTSSARTPLVLRILGSLRRLWPLLLIGGLAFAGWEELRRIDLNAVRAALHALSVPWLLVAAAITIANLALLGLYDVITLHGTSAPAMARIFALSQVTRSLTRSPSSPNLSFTKPMPPPSVSG